MILCKYLHFEQKPILYCHELQTDHLMDNKIRHTLQIFLDQESSYYSQE